ncbi:MAG: ribosome biogenesis GTPase Der [Cardiobacteriaceae bacterium]|nr:ribosome biogenesis GTPase Der [Cardiobacteriaceae bacterium]
MIKPTIALLGRPNVGKSTLFNALTKTRAALVADTPGLTRDRRYGQCSLAGEKFTVIDTGGMLHDKEEKIDRQVDKQARTAADEADVLLLLLDGKSGLTSNDEEIAQELRMTKKPLIAVVNKTDFADPNLIAADFYSLGLPLITISAEHRRGLKQMGEKIIELLENSTQYQEKLRNTEEITAKTEQDEGIKLAVLGRPNVGKSTLLNRLLGEERLVASPVAGTTRDAIFIPYEDEQGAKFTLIDTAGIRRKSQTHEKIEKFSIVKALEAIEYANVVILVLDAKSGIAEQDAKLLGEITRRGRAIIIAVNKWDNIEPEQREEIKSDLERKLHFINFAEVFYISALCGSNIRKLLPAVKKAHRNAFADLSSNELTNALQTAYHKHQPPLVQGKAIKFQYAHQGGKNPPHIIIHGSRTTKVPESYTQYLINFFRREFKLDGTAIRISYRDKENPFNNRHGR